VQSSAEIIPLAVTASLDGSSAASAYLATLELVSDAGLVMARCPCQTSIAAGVSADVSWFPLGKTAALATGPLTAYETLILSTGGIVLYWKLDDPIGSTTVVDSKGGHSGDVFGTVSFGQPKLADVTSALFAGGMVGKKVEITGIVGTQIMSVIVWVKTTSVAAQNTIAWADTSAPSGRWFQMYTDNTGKVNVNVFGTDGSGHGAISTASVNDGPKHMVGFVYSATVPATGAGAQIDIYIDGALDSSTPLAMGGFGLANTNRSLVIGARWRNAFDDPNGTAQFAGTLDEFALFTSSLNAAQMANINTAGRVP